MASKYWIKLYHEILDDHKMGMLSDRLYRRTIELFLLAGDFDKDGELPTIDSMAWRLRLSPGELELDLKELESRDIVTFRDDIWIVTKFAERQSPMSDTERQQRFRDSKRKDKYYNSWNVTNRDSSVTHSHNESLVDIDIDKESEKDGDYIANRKEEKSKPQIAYDQLLLNVEAYSGKGTDNLIYRNLTDCDIREDGDKLILIPKNENVRMYFSRALDAIKKQYFYGIDYQELEVQG